MYQICNIIKYSFIYPSKKIPLTKNWCMENSQLLQIAKDFGSPVYVYDADKIISQYNRLIMLKV